MRAVVVQPGPSFSVADVARGWVNGLRTIGVETIDLNFNDRLLFFDKACAAIWPDETDEKRDLRAIYLASHNIRADLFDIQPDVVIVISGFFVPEHWYTIVRSHGIRTVLVNTESPYEDDRQLDRAPWADLVIVNDPTNLDRFRAVNPNSHYFWHCYDPAIHYRRDPKPELVSDFAFVGTGYQSRIDFFEQVNWTGIDVAFAGQWQQLSEDSPLRPFVAHPIEHCVDNADAVDLYSSTKVSANLYRKEAERATLVDGWAMGPREVELAATETFFAREPRGEGDEVFPFLPTFSEPCEFEQILRWALAHPDKRAGLARRAYEAVSDRDFAGNARRLVALLEKE